MDLLSEVTSVTDLAPAGSLVDYVEHLSAVGSRALASRHGAYAWVHLAPGCLHRLPMEVTSPVPRAELDELLTRRGVWLVSYLEEPRDELPANTFDYICREPDYGLASLPRTSRRIVRRGLERFAVRLCTWDELLEKGYRAFAETDQRHGYRKPSPSELREFVENRRSSPFYDVLGAWLGDELAAWLTVLRVDDWALFDDGRSATDSMRWATNTLYYVAARLMLTRGKVNRCSAGLVPIQTGVHARGIHRFKTKMKYEPLAYRRVFEVHPALRPVTGSRSLARLATRLARLLPASAAVAKFAGVATCLSGLDEDPLAWAREPG